MLRSSHGKTQNTGSRSCPVLIFSVGGRRLAVKTQEVAGISEWRGSIAVPGHTRYVQSVVRTNDEVFPVFDLAGLLGVKVSGESLLCLTVKHPHGPMVICIDEDMPVLHTLDMAAIQPYRGNEFETAGSFSSGLDQIPIMNAAKLGSAQTEKIYDPIA